MVGIRHVPETVAPRIQGSQCVLQLWSCGEQGIDGPTEILLCRFQRRHGHSRLRLNPIHTVVNHGVKLSQAQVRAGLGVERPQQWAPKIQRQVCREQAQIQAPAIETTGHPLGLPGKHQGRHHPDTGADLSWQAQPTAQSPEDPTGIRTINPRSAHAQGIDIQNPMPQLSQSTGHMLLIGPERVIPISCGQKNNVCHGSQTTSSIVISRKLGDVRVNVSKSPEAMIRP